MYPLILRVFYSTLKTYVKDEVQKSAHSYHLKKVHLACLVPLDAAQSLPLCIVLAAQPDIRTGPARGCSLIPRGTYVRYPHNLVF